MRVNELKRKKVDEGIGSWIGSKLSSLGNKMQGGPAEPEDDEQVKDFINNFITNAYKSLNNEIASGRVDPNLKSGDTKPQATPAEPPKTEPAAPAASRAAPTAPGTPKKAPGNAAAPGAAQKQTTQNINNYVQGLAKSLNAEPDKGKKMALAKELVNYMADRKDYPEWQNALATAQQVIKKGVPDPNFANSAMNKLKAGQMMEAWQVYWINKLLESIGFTFNDLGLTLLKENVKNGKYVLAETKYYKLNMIFESILTEAESIEQWLTRWLPQYLRFQMNDQHTKTLIKSVQDTYAQDKGKAALTKLARAAVGAATAPGYGAGEGEPAAGAGSAGAGAGAGAGAQAAPGGASAGAAAPITPTKTGTSTDSIINSIQSSLAKLKGIDPALYADIVKKIGAGQSLQGLPGGASKPAAAPAAAPAAPVSESKRKIKK